MTRKVLQNGGCDKERLARFDRIPDTKAGLYVRIPALFFRFARAGRAVALFTEGLGPQKHHGNAVLLVNEHSASASEMVAAFAAENRFATLVGTKTAGRLLTGANSFKVGYGYRVALPVVQYRTWKETVLEGSGVDVNIHEPLSLEELWRGKDNQLAAAARAASLL